MELEESIRRNEIEYELLEKLRMLCVDGGGYFAKEDIKNTLYKNMIRGDQLAKDILENCIFKIAMLYHDPWEKIEGDIYIIYQGERFKFKTRLLKLISDVIQTLDKKPSRNLINEVYYHIFISTEINEERFLILKNYLITKNFYVFDGLKGEMLRVNYRNFYFFYSLFRDFLKYNDKIVNAISTAQKLIQEEKLQEDEDLSKNLDFMEAWEEMMSLLPFRFKLPINYNPEAKAPRWEQFLNEVLDKKYHTAIKRFAGYILYPKVLSKYPSISALVGEGSNGKSVFLRAIESVIGKENVSHIPIQAFNDKFVRNNLVDKLLNSAGDLPREGLHDTGIFKMLTAGDPTYVEEKYKNGHTEIPRAKHFVAVNELPKTNDKTTGFYRRWMIFIFPHTFMGEKADPFLEEKLLQERDGIFNWMLEGYKELFEEGDFNYPHTLEEIADMYEIASDSLTKFINEECERAEGEEILFQDFYQLYYSYCGEHNLTPKADSLVGREILTKAPWVKKDTKKIRGNKKKVLYNIRVKYKPPAERENIIAEMEKRYGYEFETEEEEEFICIQFIKNYQIQGIRYSRNQKAEMVRSKAKELIKKGIAIYCDKKPIGFKVRILKSEIMDLLGNPSPEEEEGEIIYKVFRPLNVVLEWERGGFIEIVGVIY